MKEISGEVKTEEITGDLKDFMKAIKANLNSALRKSRPTVESLNETLRLSLQMMSAFCDLIEQFEQRQFNALQTYSNKLTALELRQLIMQKILLKEGHITEEMWTEVAALELESLQDRLEIERESYDEAVAGKDPVADAVKNV